MPLPRSSPARRRLLAPAIGVLVLPLALPAVLERVPHLPFSAAAPVAAHAPPAGSRGAAFACVLAAAVALSAPPAEPTAPRRQPRRPGLAHVVLVWAGRARASR